MGNFGVAMGDWQGATGAAGQWQRLPAADRGQGKICGWKPQPLRAKACAVSAIASMTRRAWIRVMALLGSLATIHAQTARVGILTGLFGFRARTRADEFFE